ETEDTFLGFPKNNFEESRVVIFPIPLELTTCYGKGTSLGPRAIIEASKQLEFFDINTKKSLAEDISFHTLPFLEIDKSGPEINVKRIKDVVKKVLEYDKFLISFGGEHTLSFGVINGFLETFEEEFSVISFDAHADLRDSFQGTKFSHACVMRRIYEKVPIALFGTRMVSKEEYDFMLENKISWCKEFSDKILKNLPDKVYISIDLDVLDPSIMPAVGTPVAEGWSVKNLISAVEKISKNKEIIGFDVVELAPIPNFEAPNFIAAQITYEILNKILESR
ncbi:MAG: agmatinase, partial [archaeon]